MSKVFDLAEKAFDKRMRAMANRTFTLHVTGTELLAIQDRLDLSNTEMLGLAARVYRMTGEIKELRPGTLRSRPRGRSHKGQ